MQLFFTLIFIILTSLTLFSQEIYEQLPDVNSCFEGELTQDEKLKSLNVVNRIRAMHNLPPVTYDFEGDKFAQKGALVSAANKALSHEPPSSWKCFSQDAYYGNENSNLFISMGSGGTAPDSEYGFISWMIDNNVPNLGHRRAIINPFIDKMSFGRVDDLSGGTRVTAMNFKFMDNLNANISNTDIEFVAYPQGNYDKNYFMNGWYLSFSAIKNKSQWWDNQIDYSAATINMFDENNNQVSISDIGSDNSGGGALINQLKWRTSPLNNYVEYTVEIKNVKVGGNNKDFTYTFTLGDGPGKSLPIPKLQTPENNATEFEINKPLFWEIETDYEYNLQISDDQNFNNLVDDVVVTGNAYISKNIEHNKSYFWRVRAKKDDSFSEWSEVRKFTTKEYKPTLPDLVYPNDRVSRKIKPIFVWDLSVEGYSYHLQVGDRPTFSLKLVDVDNIDSLTYDSKEANFKPNTKYYWRIRSFDGEIYSDWSDTVEFSTPPLPEATSLVSPEDEEIIPEIENFKLIWNKVDFATEYGLTLYIYDKESNEVRDSISTIALDTIVNINYEDNTNYKVYFSWSITSLNSGLKGGTTNSWKFYPATHFSVKKIDNTRISIFPNPAQSFINIMLKDRSYLNNDFTLINIKGEEVLNGKINSVNQQIQIENLSIGTYFLIIKEDNNRNYFKIIKE